MTFSVILPAALLLGVLVMTWLGAGAVFCPAGEPARPMQGRGERWYGVAVALVYAVVAFAGLGERRAPESWCVLDEGESVEFTVPQGAVAAKLRFFSGINTGEIRVECSDDGAHWKDAATLEQNYVAVLRWNDAGTEASGRRFRLTGLGRELDIGELGLYDAAGARIVPDWSDGGAAGLFDEPDTVPEKISYLNGSYFDEIYHVRTAWESLKFDGMYEVTHPPLGKLIIALGLLLFGVNPFGWRFMGTLCGVLMLPMLYDFLRRLFGRSSVALSGTVIFAFDFMHFTQTRLATIDSYSVFFILGMYYYMYRFCSEEEHGGRHLLLSGLFFGLGAATRWTCLYAGAGLAVIWLLHWVRRREAFRTAGFWVNVCECILCFVTIPCLIYYLSYYPYGRTAGLGGLGMFFDPRYGKIVWNNQVSMWSYHSSLVATHPYSSVWWQWVLDIRPILYYLDGTAAEKSAIAAFTGPLLCWGGLGAMLLCAAAAVGKRDGRAAFIVLGYLSQLLPWMLVTRLTFAYHYFPSEIFLTLAMGYALSRIEEKRGRGWVTLGASVAAMALFALFYPVLSGVPVARSYCSRLLQWFPSWPV